MSYVSEHIAGTLRAAREAKGLSQRALSAKVGVPQSHISKIENGAVDLRVSSLVALARVLDLELMLVPRKAVSAVQSIVRSTAERGLTAEQAMRRSPSELKRLQASVAKLTQTHPAVSELAQLQRQVRALRDFPIPPRELQLIRDAADAVKRFQDDAASLTAIRDAAYQLHNLRNLLAHGIDYRQEREAVRPAYSLDEDDHG